MIALSLEDFGTAAPPRPQMEARDTLADGPPTSLYDDGYNAGWEDALAHLEAERTRIGDALSARLADMRQTREEADAAALRALEPALTEIFDKLLPHAAGRAFLPLLLQEAEAMLDETSGRATLLLAPEELPSLEALVAGRPDLAARLELRAEPALSLSQALLRWPEGERRVDLEAVLAALDDALEQFLTPPAPVPEDIAHAQ